MAICPSCGEENPDKFRLCGYCGAALAAAVASPRETRKTVTVLFSDLKGSTQLGERLDSETLREVMNRYFAEMRGAIERHGGMVEKFIGDAVMAVFGLPNAHEDDALRAVRAAWDMKLALADLNGELERRWAVTLANRTGVNTGEVVANAAADRQRLVTGDTINVAARLEQAAPALEVLIGEPTYRLVRDAVDVEPVEPLELKGKSARVAAFCLRGVRSGAMLDRRPDAPLVGRTDELDALRRAFDETVATGSLQVLTVLAHPGLGKSRLVRAFTDGYPTDVTVLHGGCLSYGEGITFWPLAEAVRSWAGISADFTHDEAVHRLALLPCDERVTERIASMMALSQVDFSLDEIFWAVRELLRAAAARSPVVLVLEDMHWAEQTLFDLLAWLRGSGGDLPVLVVVTARPDLIEHHPEWADEATSTVLRLHPLAAGDAVTVAENALGASLDPATRERIAAAAEGNPLFVEQMLSMLIDDGLLVHRDGTWHASRDLSSVEMPPTISALLTARIDSLREEERAIIEPSAVVGRSFYRSAIEHMTAADGAHVDAQLGALIRKEYVQAERALLVMGDTFQFNHALVRDAVYGGLLKRRRCELHERFADWVTGVLGDRLGEYEEIVGYHLEQAARYHAELGEIDEKARLLAHRAADHLGAVGRRALARGDMPTAAGLLRRARDVLAPDEARRLGLVFDLTEVLIEQGEFAEAERMLDESERQSAGDELGTLEVRLARMVERFAVAPESWNDGVRRDLELAIERFDAVDNHVAVAKGWRLLGTIHGAQCRYGEAEHAVEQTILHARKAGDSPLELRNLAPFAFIALAGPMPVAAAIARCRALITQAGDDRRTEGVIRCALAQLEAMEGRFAEAREHYQAARTMLTELGVKVLAASVSLNAGPVEMLAGDPMAAERALRSDAAELEGMGERYLLPCVTGYLSQAVLEQGRFDEADELAARCAESSAADDVEAQVIWRRVRAQIWAARGRSDQAAALAEDAVRLADTTDSPSLRADTLADFATVLRDCGLANDAASVAERALRLYEEKGNRIAADRLRQSGALTAAPISMRSAG